MIYHLGQGKHFYSKSHLLKDLKMDGIGMCEPGRIFSARMLEEESSGQIGSAL